MSRENAFRWSDPMRTRLRRAAAIAAPPCGFSTSFDFGWRSGSPLRYAASFSVLALAAEGECRAHKEFFSSL